MSIQRMYGGALAVLLLSLCASATGAELVTNGTFEANGGVNTNSFSGWTVTDQAGGSGSWYAQSGTSPPGAFGSGLTVAAPPQGTFAAMTAQSGGGSHILSQNITIPAGAAAKFSAMVYVNNAAAAFSTPATLDYTVNPNQQFRIDVMTTASPLTDMGAGILLNVYQTKVGDPLVSGYVTVTADLSAFAGQTVRLRFAEADNQLYLSAGVDVVSVQTGSTAVPTLSQYALFALAALLLGLGIVAARRRG